MTLCLDVCDMRDARDERTDGGTTTGASMGGPTNCCSSELLDETDSTGVAGGHAHRKSATTHAHLSVATTVAKSDNGLTTTMTVQSVFRQTFVPTNLYIQQHTD